MWKVVKQVPPSVRPLILVGAGNLGSTLCSNYNEFEGKGLKIVAAFDNDPIKCGASLGHIAEVEHVSAIHRIAKESGAKIAILAIPGEKAQEITRMCIEAGINTILNYSPVPLNVPTHVHVENMDPALKIQMALNASHTKYEAPRVKAPMHFGWQSTAFPGQINQQITPLLAAVPRLQCTYSPSSRGYAPARSFSTASSYNMRQSGLTQQTERFSNDFQELRMLGKGGFGSVFQVRHHIDGMDYAVKKIRINLKPNAIGELNDHKYLREARAMARLNHANIVRYLNAWIEHDNQKANYYDDEASMYSSSSNGSESLSAYDSGEQTTGYSDDAVSTASNSFSSVAVRGNKGTVPVEHRSDKSAHIKLVLYIQMEFCTGETLKEWLSRPERVVVVSHCRSILAQLVEGLNYMHSHGFIHRDVTPPNIFLEHVANGIIVKIGDFGLTKQCGDIITDTEEVSIQSGDKTIGVGTLLYASPEQLSNAVYDTRADMYSVGVILFELLHPFATQMERVFHLTQIRQGNIPTPIVIKYPLESELVERLLNVDPSQRFSAQEILTRVKHTL